MDPTTPKTRTPLQVIRVRSPADDLDYDVSVQAVHRSGHTHNSYLIIRWEGRAHTCVTCHPPTRTALTGLGAGL